MAEAIGLASGLLTLAAFAFQSSVKLYETVKSFQSHQQRVRDLVEELGALGGVLSSLAETANATTDVDLSALKIPLLRCGNACRDFENEILKCSSRSESSRTSFRNWAKLRYMGEDMDGFRRLLAGYKLTVCIALTDANLRKSSATAESIESYNDLLDTARATLEDRLESIDEKLELVLGRSSAGHEQDVSEARAIKEERLSTEKCLQICTQLSDHINQIQRAAKDKTKHDESVGSDSFPERITHEGLQECKDSLIRIALKLEGHHKQLFSRLIDKSRTVAISEEERADLTRLQDEWESTRQGIDICSRAHGHLQDNISTIDNYAIGDAVQFMVSTSQKTIHGRNRGLGWRTRQVGGHISDDTLRHIALSLANIDIPNSRHEGYPPQGDTTTTPDNGLGKKADLKFKEQYGTGFKLTSDIPVDASEPSTEPLKDRANTSPRDSFIKSAQNRGANPQ